MRTMRSSSTVHVGAVLALLAMLEVVSTIVGQLDASQVAVAQVMPLPFRGILPATEVDRRRMKLALPTNYPKAQHLSAREQVCHTPRWLRWVGLLVLSPVSALSAFQNILRRRFTVMEKLLINLVARSWNLWLIVTLWLKVFQPVYTQMADSFGMKTAWLVVSRGTVVFNTAFQFAVAWWFDAREAGVLGFRRYTAWFKIGKDIIGHPRSLLVILFGWPLYVLIPPMIAPITSPVPSGFWLLYGQMLCFQCAADFVYHSLHRFFHSQP